MPVIQVGLAVAPEAYARLVTGEYIRCTGVAKDGPGKVARLIDSTEAGKELRENVQRIAKQAIDSGSVQAIAVKTVKSKQVRKFAKSAVDPKNLKMIAKRAAESKNVYLFAGAAVLVGGAAVAAKVVNDKKKVAEQNVPACVPGLNQAFAAYFEAAYREKLDAGTVAVLEARLDEIEALAAEGATKLTLSAKLLAESAQVMSDYTVQLADVNSTPFEPVHLELDAESDESLGVIRGCLDAQLDIFVVMAAS